MLKMFSQFSFLSGEKKEHKESDILRAYSALIEALPESLLIEMRNQNDPFYFSPGISLESVEIANGLRILKSTMESPTRRSDILQECLQKLSERLNEIHQIVSRQAKIRRKIQLPFKLPALLDLPGYDRKDVKAFLSPSGDKVLVHDTGILDRLVDIQSKNILEIPAT